MFQIIFSGQLSGKTSIKKVIFDKIPPEISEISGQLNKEYNNKLYSFGYCQLNIIEFPSSFSYKNNFKECEQYLNKCNALIFVYDYNTKTDYQMDYFRKNILPIITKFKNISLYIFIHKMDYYNCNSILQSQYNEEVKQIKSEIEPMNNSSKNVQNSKTYIYFYKDKGKNKELDLKAISCKRTELQGTPLKLYIKEKKLENKSNLPRVYCNFKYINLGSNVHFQRNVIQIVHPKNKTNENKKSIIDFSNSLIDTYKLYQKKKKENKNIFIFNNNIYQNSQNKFYLNDSKKSDSELKKEVVKVGKLLNFKNNNSKNT